MLYLLDISRLFTKIVRLIDSKVIGIRSNKITNLKFDTVKSTDDQKVAFI